MFNIAEATIRSSDKVTFTMTATDEEGIVTKLSVRVEKVPGIWAATRTPEDVRNALDQAGFPHFEHASDSYGGINAQGEETFTVSGPLTPQVEE